MRFSDIRSNVETENKQRINLSGHAYTVLQQDASVFFSDRPTKTETGGIPSGILNHIFYHFRESAESSIEEALGSRKQQLLSLLRPMSSGQQEAIALLLGVYRSELEQKTKDRLSQKGCSFSFRIDSANLRELSTEGIQRESCHYQDKVGLYWKAIIEEFCGLPYSEREKIYQKEHWNSILSAISRKKRLKLVLRSTYQTAAGKTNTWYIRPMAILQDSEKMYNYLTGMVRSELDEDWKCGAFRISSIVSCKEQERHGGVTAEEKRTLEALIKQNGVQYLSSGKQTQQIQVRLTKSGVELYHRILHLRPMFTEKHQDGDSWLYTFDCLPWQAETYFFKFGKDALILTPLPLSDLLRKKHFEAWEAYRTLAADTNGKANS